MEFQKVVLVSVIAAEAGMSRSTLLRRLGGTRAALDEAVLERALAAAELVQEAGPGGTTLETAAPRAGCSTDALYANFGSRDELVAAVFGRYSPLPDVDDLVAADDADPGTTVRRASRRLSEALTREPRVAPSIIAEVLARPAAPTARSVAARNAPQTLGVVVGWLAGVGPARPGTGQRGVRRGVPAGGSHHPIFERTPPCGNGSRGTGVRSAWAWPWCSSCSCCPPTSYGTGPTCRDGETRSGSPGPPTSPTCCTTSRSTASTPWGGPSTSRSPHAMPSGSATTPRAR
ncbi:MAG: TetR family transcriptional regulator [Dactylosporangium sp.]|nr:TetR family transcriptional regulator [Dactylosporangium sp.]